MIGLILKTLNLTPIFVSQNLVDLQNYLASSYPGVDSETLQQIMAEFISKTIDSCLIYFSEDYRQSLRQIIMDNARKLSVFEVYASDILKAGLQLGKIAPAFQQELANWVGEFPVDGLTREAVVAYILNHCREVAKPDNWQINPNGVAQPKHHTSISTGVRRDEPYARTVAPPQDYFQNDRPMAETQSFIPWVNPYWDQESEVNDGRGAAAKAFGADCGSGRRVGWWGNFFKVHLRRLFKNRNVCIAIAVTTFLLIGFPRVFSSKNAVSGQALIQSDLQPNQASVYKTSTFSELTPQVAIAKQSPEGAGATRSTLPILAAPNTIIVGYIKEKTAAGLVDMPVRRYFQRKMRLKATAYDLSVSSCGKDVTHPDYGITRTGTRAKRGRTIAVDPRVIPLGRKVYIVFPKKYRHLNGIYVAEDTGRKIKGYRIDIFWGEDGPGERTVHKAARVFGRQKVEIYLLQD
jgi:3D (Asp-Asp-Asp) domain-containing protein